MKYLNFNKFKYNRFNPSVNEWLNSIYTFDKNKLNTFWSNKIVFELINSYFNIKPQNVTFFKKVNKNLALKRVFVSLPEIKNSLNNNNIFIYIFNKEKIIFNKKINKLQTLSKYKNKNSINLIETNQSSKNLNILLSSTVNNLNSKLINLNIFNFIKIYINRLKTFNLKINKEILKTLHIKIYQDFFNKEIIENKISDFNLHKRNLKTNFIKDIDMEEDLSKVRLIMKKKYYILFFYKRYITRLYFNNLKFNYINLLNLSKILYKIYNKNININIINLKYLHLDNSLFIDAIVRKLKRRKSKVLRVLRKALILPKIPRIEPMYLLRKELLPQIPDKENEPSNNLLNYEKHLDLKNIKKVIFESLKNIHLIGVRLEGKGRLTRRLTASRAVYKKAYKGNLKNVYSSFKELSAVMSKGFNKSNVNYINLNSYNRNGSYGIKSWHNTM